MISIYSFTPGVLLHNRSLSNLKESIEPVNVVLDKYPGHLFRWDHIPSNLDRKRIFLFTDTADVIFQKPIPVLLPDRLYVANEGEIFKNNRFWRAVMRRNPQFLSLENESIYNVGTFACSGDLMDDWVTFLQHARNSVRSMVTEQLIFNNWLRQPKIRPKITELPDLFTSLYANLEKGITIKDKGKGYINKRGELYSVVHFNGNTKILMSDIP